MRTILFSLIISFFLSGCANRVTPTGGQKDILPPEIVKVIPNNETVNFSAKKIVIAFNEYIQLKDIATQLVISPLIFPPPTIAVINKNLVIELPDSLSPNTTYTIHFGNAIVDNNEGNVFPGYSYVFSTGNELDSLKLTGVILNAETNKPEKGTLALLYSTAMADTSWLKSPPDYFSRAAEDGTFVIRNIRSGMYRLFALNDKNNNYILDLKDETAGFESQSFELKDSMYLKVFIAPQAAVKQIVKGSVIEEPGKIVTTFSKSVISPSWKFLDVAAEKVLSEISIKSDTVILYVLPTYLDSMKIEWSDGETILDTVKYTKSRAASKPIPAKAKEFTKWSSTPLSGGNLKGESHPQIKWAMPVMTFDESKILVTKDSIPHSAKISFTDSVKTNLQIESKWTEGSYKVLVLPEAILDFAGNSNDTVAISFVVPSERSAGSISFKINSQSQSDMILQLVTDKDEVVRQRFFTGSSSGIFEMVDPGSYKLRLIVDANSNKLWDSGDFRKSIQPEKIDYHPDQITVRSNWEVEVVWDR